MIIEQFGTEIMSIISAAAASLITYLTTRKRQKADTKKIEVDVWEKTLEVMQQKLVVPLTARIDSLQNENEKIINQLTNLRNAINKMYKCRDLINCPIRDELRKQQKGRTQQRNKGINRRQRESKNEDNDAPINPAAVTGDDECFPP